MGKKADGDRAGKNARRRVVLPGPRRHRGELPLIAESLAMLRDLEEAKRIAQTDRPVLLCGETGVGKERMARFIHEQGPWRDGPFVAVNCGAIPEALFESEMFGHEKGAFTGADSRRAGHLRAAAGGTILLDEVGDLSPGGQVKLLRVLDGREVHPVGSDRPFLLDARVISAAEVDLGHLVKAGRFRRALLHRLSAQVLVVRPLRERPEDILAVAEELVDGASLAPRMRAILLLHHWPGNVRELCNVVPTVVQKALHKRRLLGGTEPMPSNLEGATTAFLAYAASMRQVLGRDPTDLEAAAVVVMRRLGRMPGAALARRTGAGERTLRRMLPHLLAPGLLTRGGQGRGAFLDLGPAAEALP